MKAKVQYNDFKGTVAADISDMIAVNKGNYISSIGEYFGVDQERFRVVGVSLQGIQDFELTMLCVDKEKSTPFKDHLVKMQFDLDAEGQKQMLGLLFKRLNVVLFDSGEENLDSDNYDEIVNYADHHQKEYLD
ncbi:hypothetical protein M2306_002226 [Myroides gitamensis]|uniref:Uncharacterized protein n=1 Tax=Myroides odoratus TaxID=256 RepID=A0A378U6Q2_MYROD|nr:hypothetical protein [Myroides odoratus]MCS4237724.1 hypothetical protein [Myroides odoratus]MDH6601532.1 hypothetical protein [Myroides gitamensis]QQU02753.1 hypothetical protein I6I89_13125 [Myroides odoratus]STZ70022.1 Uncharacterised protein [Myroides odoratus]